MIFLDGFNKREINKDTTVWLQKLKNLANSDPTILFWKEH